MKKKIFKRAGVAVLSMAMLLSMGAIGGLSASAVKDNTTDITITAPASAGSTTATYTIYKVCNATPNANGSAYTYSMATGFDTVTLSQILDCADTNAARKTLADALVADITTGTTATAVTTVNSGTTTTLKAGYYLAIMNPTGTTMTAAPILFSVDSEVNAGGITLQTKTSQPDLTKTIEAIDKGTVDANSVDAEGAIGATVSYQLTSTLPNYAPTVTAENVEYYIVDTPATGITILDGNNTYTLNGSNVTSNTNTVTITSSAGEITANDYTLDLTGTGIKLQIKGAYVLANGGATITVSYNAIINDNALISTDATSQANTNTAKLYYDNDYYTASKSGTPDNPGDLTEIDKDTDVYTTKLVFTKLFGGDNTPVAGATFTVTGPNNYSKTLTTTADAGGNVFTLTGLEAGTYTVTETATNPAYTLNANPVTTIVISADTDANDVYSFTYTNANTSSGENFTVNNTPKSNLPGTGGMGTILFTVGGAAIVLLAGAMFVLYMKKRRVEE